VKKEKPGAHPLGVNFKQDYTLRKGNMSVSNQPC
jgi:hypothetical protein